MPWSPDTGSGTCAGRNPAGDLGGTGHAGTGRYGDVVVPEWGPPVQLHDPPLPGPVAALLEVRRQWGGGDLDETVSRLEAAGHRMRWAALSDSTSRAKADRQRASPERSPWCRLGESIPNLLISTRQHAVALGI